MNQIQLSIQPNNMHSTYYVFQMKYYMQIR
jgi:hypothetical protein